MTAQMKRELLKRKGEQTAKKILGGKRISYKAPFDLVDFQNGIAYEVKTMSGFSKDLKINVNPKAMKRKKHFMRMYGVRRAYIIAVVVYSPKKVEVYRSRLVNSVRVRQMIQISTSKVN